MSDRYGKYVKGFRTFTDDWTNMKSSSSSASAPTSPNDFHYSDAKGVWNTRSTAQFPKIQTDAGFTVVGQTSYASSGTVSGSVGINVPAGTAIGDMLIVIAQGGTTPLTMPAGWSSATSASTANQIAYVSYTTLASVPSTITITTASATVFNAVLFAVRKSTGSPTFNMVNPTLDSSLTSVVFPSVTVSASSLVIVASLVRGAALTGVVVPNLATPYVELAEIMNATSTQASRNEMVEYQAVSPSGSTVITPSTKTLPETVGGVIGITFFIS